MEESGSEGLDELLEQRKDTFLKVNFTSIRTAIYLIEIYFLTSDVLNVFKNMSVNELCLSVSYL